jgi:DNA polymerase-1
VSRILYEELGLPDVGVRTKTGNLSTDKHALEALVVTTGHNFPRLLQNYRKYATILGTFVKGVRLRQDEGNRLHPHFLSARTVSGRVVCVNPNLANIPKTREYEEGVLISIRGLYVARPGWKIVYGDWKQIEFKCAALLSGDEALIEAMFEREEDFHTLTAEAIYSDFGSYKRELQDIETALTHETNSMRIRSLESRSDVLHAALSNMRRDAKVVNFGTLYGGSDLGVAALLGVDVDEVAKITERRAAAFPKLAAFIELTPALALEQGFLQTVFGRKRRFPYTPSEYVRSSQGRQGINVGPQSAAAYVGRGALVRVCKASKQRGMKGYPFNVVYDSILGEYPDKEVYEAIHLFSREMTRPVPQLENRVFSIDLGVGQTWDEAESRAVKVSQPLRTRTAINDAMTNLKEILNGV